MQELPVGDAIITNEAGEVVATMERKRIPDLINSIMDGRYHNQSMRLDNPLNGVVY